MSDRIPMAAGAAVAGAVALVVVRSRRRSARRDPALPLLEAVAAAIDLIAAYLERVAAEGFLPSGRCGRR